MKIAQTPLWRILLCFFILSCARHPCTTDTGKTAADYHQQERQQNSDVAARWINEIWGAENIGKVDELLTSDFVFNWAPPGVTGDVAGYKLLLTAEFASFSDHRFTIDDMVSTGHKVVVRWSSRAIHTGDYYGIPPSGKEISMTGISILRIENGKIAEEHTEMDTAGFMKQLEENAR